MNPIFYFLFALTLVLAATAEPVLDIDGNIIFGGSYYVLPVIRGRGGGLTLSGHAGEPCPLGIVQAASEVDEGIPVKFSNWKSRVGFVPESEILNIEMDTAATICVESTYWWVNGLYNIPERKSFVVAGPKPEGFGKDSLNSFFKIVKADYFDHAYEFKFCPLDCYYVGVAADENGVHRLALKSEPFLVVFKKANEEESSSKIM